MTAQKTEKTAENLVSFYKESKKKKRKKAGEKRLFYFTIHSLRINNIKWHHIFKQS